MVQLFYQNLSKNFSTCQIDTWTSVDLDRGGGGRSGSVRIQVWFRPGSHLVQVWFRPGSCLVQAWFRFGSGLVQARFRPGSDLQPVISSPWIITVLWCKHHLPYSVGASVAGIIRQTSGLSLHVPSCPSMEELLPSAELHPNSNLHF